MKIPQLQFDNFGLRHLPRLNPVRKHFGLRWPGEYPPPETIRDWLFAALAAAIFLLVSSLIATNDRLAIAEAQASQKVAALGKSEVALVALLNNQSVAAGDDIISCDVRRIKLVGAQ